MTRLIMAGAAGGSGDSCRKDGDACRVRKCLHQRKMPANRLEVMGTKYLRGLHLGVPTGNIVPRVAGGPPTHFHEQARGA